MKSLLDGLMMMANDLNERHEENESTDFKHSDGWSIIYEKDHQLQIYKSLKPCYEDERLFDFESLQSLFVSLHARKASVGEISYHNVHPFVDTLNGKTFAFCHNGTVRDNFDISPIYKPKGNVDSERFFYYILTHLDAADLVSSYKKILKSIMNYSSMNSFLCSIDQSFIVNQYTLNPRYYTMKLTQDDASIIISSEVLPTLPNRRWTPLKNMTFIKIVHKNLTPVMEISSVDD